MTGAMRYVYTQFEGIHGERVSVHRSAESGDPRVWLVADRGGDNNGALHLTPEQAKDVRDALDVFVGDAERLQIAAKRAQRWAVGDLDPGFVQVRDRQGRVWYPYSGGWRHSLMDPYATIAWPLLLERHGPVVWEKDLT